MSQSELGNLWAGIGTIPYSQASWSCLIAVVCVYHKTENKNS